MNRILLFGIIAVFILGCSLNQKEVIILKNIDHFKTQEENIQLGIDLLNFNYNPFFKSEFPDLPQDVFNNIEWSYFLQESNKEVSFRLTLSNKAIQHKERIISFFERKVNAQVDKQVQDKQIFLNAIEQTTDNLEMLDNHMVESFWSNTSSVFRKRTTKDEFFEIAKERDGILKEGDLRVLLYKQYYKSIPGVDETELYVVCYTFKNDNNMFEQLTYNYQNDSLKIIGYDYRMANKEK